MTLGPRVLKTGLSVTLALYLCSFFSLESALFAGVAAIFTVQPSIYRTWRHVVDQVITNTLGAAIALFAITFWGNDPFTIGIVMILVILFSIKMKMEATISITLVTVLAIMSSHANQDWLFALNRFWSILIGISSGFLVNLIIFPPKYKKNYIEQLKNSFQKMSLLLRTAISNEMTERAFREHKSGLTKDLLKLEEMYKTFDEEREKMARLNPIDVREIVVFKQMLKTIQQGEELLQVIDEHFFQSKTDDNENELFDGQLEDLIKYHEYLFMKFEGMIKPDENHLENMMIKTGTFLEQVIGVEKKDQDQKLRLVVVGASIFEYSFQIHRLNRLIESYIKAKN